MRRRLRFQIDDPEGVVAILVLGAGIVAWAAGVDRWWLIFALGWLVVVPLIDELTTRVEATDPVEDEDRDEADTALDALRERYAAGEITEAEFERRLERLLETESVEDARERIRERGRERGREAEGAR